MVYSSTNFLQHPSKHLMTPERVDWMIISQHEGCSFLVIQKNHGWAYSHKSLQSKSYIFMKLYMLYDFGFLHRLFVTSSQGLPCGWNPHRIQNIKSEKPSTNNHCGINLFHLERKLVQTKSQIMIYMPHSYVASTAYNLYHMTVLYSFKQNISNICKTVVFPSSFLCMFFWGWLSLPFF